MKAFFCLRRRYPQMHLFSASGGVPDLAQILARVIAFVTCVIFLTEVFDFIYLRQHSGFEFSPKTEIKKGTPDSHRDHRTNLFWKTCAETGTCASLGSLCNSETSKSKC